MRLGVDQNTSSEVCNIYTAFLGTCGSLIDWPYKQDTPSIVRIVMTFAGSSEPPLVWVNLRSVVTSWQKSSLLNLHVIPLIKGGLSILTWQSQLESSKRESAVMLSMLHSEGVEHLTTLASVSLGIAGLSISSIWYCGSKPVKPGKPGILWTSKHSILLEQLLTPVVEVFMENGSIVALLWMGCEKTNQLDIWKTKNYFWKFFDGWAMPDTNAQDNHPGKDFITTNHVS